jgi:hypothetical protein
VGLEEEEVVLPHQQVEQETLRQQLHHKEILVVPVPLLHNQRQHFNLQVVVVVLAVMVVRLLIHQLLLMVEMVELEQLHLGFHHHFQLVKHLELVNIFLVVEVAQVLDQLMEIPLVVAQEDLVVVDKGKYMLHQTRLHFL